MRIYWGAIVVALAIGAIGCGSGGDTTEVALTKAQFIKRGDAVCSTRQAEKTKAITTWMRSLPREKRKVAAWTREERGQKYLEIALPPVEGAWRELAELAEPAPDVKAEQFVDSLGSIVRTIQDEPTRALEGFPFDGTDKLATAYGFKVCSHF